jgi:hypothetical protein
VKCFARLRSVNPGFDPAEVLQLEVGLSAARYSTASLVALFYQDLVE